MKIAIFYHCFFYLGDELREQACRIVNEQMRVLQSSWLYAAADEFHAGINGGTESMGVAKLFLPARAKQTFHGQKCRNECRTILMLEEWLKKKSDPWAVFYFHAKGSGHFGGNSKNEVLTVEWLHCMMRHCVIGWKPCVDSLANGFDAAGAHWIPDAGPDKDQRIFAGNFWWSTSDYLKSLPSITERDRIRMSGIDSFESRYEAEVWIGNGPRKPVVRDMHKANSPPCDFDTSPFM